MATKTKNESTAAEATVAEATVAETTAPETPKNDLVEVFVERGSALDEPNLVVGINGQNYVLPRGKSTLVPPHVAAEVNRSRKAQAIWDQHVEAMRK